MASKVNVTVVTPKGRKDFTSKFTSKGLLVLQAESVSSDAWINSAESFGDGLVGLFTDEDLKDCTIEVAAEPTQYLQGKLYTWSFGKVAEYMTIAKKIAEVIGELTAPGIIVTAPKLDAPKGVTTPKSGKVGVTAESLKADLV